MPATAWMCGGGRFFCGAAIWRAGVGSLLRRRQEAFTALLSDARIDACLRANYDESVWHYVYFASHPMTNACMRFTAAGPSCWLAGLVSYSR